MLPSAGLHRCSPTIAEPRTSGGIDTVLRLGCILLAVALCGCHAELDWREVAPHEGGFSVLLPARAHEASRPLAGFKGDPVMHLWSAKAADTLFGAGYVDFDATDARMLAAIRDALVRNIGGKIVAERAVKTGVTEGVEFVAEGSISNAPAVLHGRVLVSARRVYQLAVIGPAHSVTAADREMFLESFRLRTAPQ
jgi:hypothetical protein